ncbi:hypothetical protein QAD02_001357 [Eretmocerus hayati]|uniref:Uncharacterized protein n=1 Tax=Eretmocerus hayati TaxID=131215 RepID=A0ACC2NH20_9HYME|nr:hypothetical protein QAD02_001357 [Eretmocerus hayati]
MILLGFISTLALVLLEIQGSIFSSPCTNILLKHLKEIQAIPFINLVVESNHEFSPIHELVMTLVSEGMPTIITSMADPDSMERTCSLTTEMAVEMKRKYLTIGFVDAQNGSRLDEKMSKMLGFLLTQNPLFRRRSLILLVNDRESTFDDFLRLAWEEKFLDLTVIEWVQERAADGGEGQEEKQQHQKEEHGEGIKGVTKLHSGTEPHCGIFIHIFNPFYNTYSRSILSKNSSLFPDKLRDLYGFTFNVKSRQGLNESIPVPGDNYKSVEVALRDSDFDIRLTKALAEELNFSYILNYTYDKELIFERFDHMSLFRIEDKQRESFDFGFALRPTELIVPEMYNSLFQNGTECSAYSVITEEKYHSLSLGFQVAIEQYIPPKHAMSLKITVIVMIFLSVGLIFLISSRVFNLNSENWTFSKIMKILVGIPIEDQGLNSTLERIIKITMYAASGLLLFHTSDGMLNFILVHQEFVMLRTLQDVAESGLDLYIANHTSELLISAIKVPVIRSILDRAIIYDVAAPNNVSWNDRPRGTRHARIFTGFWNGVERGVSYVPEDDTDVGIVRMTFLEDTQFLRPYALTMSFASTSFFMDRFRAISMRLYETGLLNYLWNSESMTHMRLPGYSKEIDSQSIDEDRPCDKTLNDRLFCILVTGYSIALVALIFEMMWKYFGFDNHRKYPLLHRILSGCPNSGRSSTRNFSMLRVTNCGGSLTMNHQRLRNFETGKITGCGVTSRKYCRNHQTIPLHTGPLYPRRLDYENVLKIWSEAAPCAMKNFECWQSDMAFCSSV